MALAMAVALWFFAINRYTNELSEVVYLEISIPLGFTILNQSAEYVTVNLKGPQKLIDQFNKLITDNKIKVQCRIPDDIDKEADPIKKSIILTRDHLNLPDDIILESIYPDTVNVELSRLEKKYISVRLVKQGQPASGFTIENEFVYPGEVEVIGASNIIKSVSQINTIPINISGITSEKNRTFPWIINVEQNVEVTQNGVNTLIPIKCKEQVRVWFSISELQNEKTLSKININILHPTDYPYHVTLQESYIDLTVKGSKLMIDKLTAKDVISYIDVSLLKPPGPYKQPINVKLPKGIEIKDQTPAVLVDLENAAQKN